MEKIRLQEFADFVAKKFNDNKISVPMRWLWLGNYVDSILRYAKWYFVTRCTYSVANLDVMSFIVVIVVA